MQNNPYMLAYMGFFLENQIVSSVLPAGPTEVTMQLKIQVFYRFSSKNLYI